MDSDTKILDVAPGKEIKPDKGDGRQESLLKEKPDLENDGCPTERPEGEKKQNQPQDEAVAEENGLTRPVNKGNPALLFDGPPSSTTIPNSRGVSLTKEQEGKERGGCQDSLQQEEKPDLDNDGCPTERPEGDKKQNQPQDEAVAEENGLTSPVNKDRRRSYDESSFFKQNEDASAEASAPKGNPSLLIDGPPSSTVIPNSRGVGLALDDSVDVAPPSAPVQRTNKRRRSRQFKESRQIDVTRYGGDNTGYGVDVAPPATSVQGNDEGRRTRQSRKNGQNDLTGDEDSTDEDRGKLVASGFQSNRAGEDRDSRRSTVAYRRLLAEKMFSGRLKRSVEPPLDVQLLGAAEKKLTGLFRSTTHWIAGVGKGKKTGCDPMCLLDSFYADNWAAWVSERSDELKDPERTEEKENLEQSVHMEDSPQ